jgi:MoaA/NifB/PqqE/SkfB family radical SAM enzyme
MEIALSPAEKARGVAKFLAVKLARRPVSVSIEVTKRCNARCAFCDYWKNGGRDELADFTDVVRRFDPLVVVLTGGEPMLRRDLVELVRSIRALPGFRYLVVLTHGGFLSEERVRELVAAGVNQINVSLDYPDERQDAERGLPGLFRRLSDLVPRMSAAGCRVFNLAPMILADNLGDLERLVLLAHAWGVNIAFSGYNDMKNGNPAGFVPPERLDELRTVCRRLVELKRRYRNVLTGDWFFENLPTFYATREFPGCTAGRTMIHVAPDGMVKPCAELAPVAHYTDFVPRRYRGAGCGRCFDACRTEPEAPLTLRRVGEITGLW